MGDIDFGKLFNKLCEQSGKSNAEIARGLDIDKATVGRWRTGERSPKLSSLSTIADYFNVDIKIFSRSKTQTENESAFQYGNDTANREYLADKPELLEIYNEITTRDDIALLFDKTKDLEPKDVESVLMFVQTIRNQRGLD